MASCLSDLAQRVEVIPRGFILTLADNMLYEAYDKKVGADNFQVRPAAPPICQFGLRVFVHLVVSGSWCDRAVPVSQLHFCPIGDTFLLGPFALSWGGIGLGAWDGYPIAPGTPGVVLKRSMGRWAYGKSPYCFFVR